MAEKIESTEVDEKVKFGDKVKNFLKPVSHKIGVAIAGGAFVLTAIAVLSKPSLEQWLEEEKDRRERDTLTIEEYDDIDKSMEIDS